MQHEFVQKLDAIEDGFIKLSEYELLKQEIASIKETIEGRRNVIKKSVQHNLAPGIIAFLRSSSKPAK